ncbi:hypothetical protein EES44_07895 [Streptomyces sp. ADI96-15]|uniref:hypothetical protein n=1 Tax=Streptomyces sp. ADI96-15 TaxID=1522761 RepID=UPI000FA24652|nr:hypothetical protein [Streptomyces sp. ADI96-15]RPK69043.1 hypothetical protein EES44_07895 [Streptomyces sp. ADI96-15]
MTTTHLQLAALAVVLLAAAVGLLARARADRRATRRRLAEARAAYARTVATTQPRREEP